MHTIDEVELTTTPAEALKPIDFARRKWIPRRDGNRPVSPSTMYRWAKKGVKGIRLKILFTPGEAVTSEAACREFMRRVDEARRSEFTDATVVDVSNSELIAAGLK